MDETIITALCRQEPEGMVQLYQTYGDMLYYVIGGIVAEKAHKDACMQLVYAEISEDIESYRPELGAFSDWLVAVARKTAMAYGKDKNKAVPAVGEQSDIAAKKLQALLNEFTPKERPIFERAYYLCQPAAQIGAELCLTPKQVEKRLCFINKKIETLFINHEELETALSQMQTAKEFGKNSTPWNSSVTFIAWGLTLSILHLNFLGLQYLLPLIGAVFLCIGLYGLQKENRWFYGAWLIAVGQAGWQGVRLVQLTTPLTLGGADSLIWLGLQLGMLLCLHQAFQGLFRGVKQGKSPFIQMITWFVLVWICIVLSIGQLTLVALALCILYLKRCNGFFTLRQKLWPVGYYIKPKPIKASVKAMLCSCLAGGFVLACAFGWGTIYKALRPFPVMENTQSVTRQTLLTMGFPEELLFDLPDEQVEQLSNTVNLQIAHRPLSFYRTPTGSMWAQPEPYGNLVTIVAEQPEEEVYALVYFKQKKMPYFWQDGFELSAHGLLEPVDGRLLYSKEGQKMFSPIALQNAPDYYTAKGVITYPFGAQEQRGYLLFKIKNVGPQHWLDIRFEYIHPPLPFLFPKANSPQASTWWQGEQFCYVFTQ